MESVLANFLWLDYISNSTNIGWLAQMGLIIRVVLLHMSGVVRLAEFPPATLQQVHVFRVHPSQSFN